jgi:glycosyltransferase involved in cell wall biosynthesis
LHHGVSSSAFFEKSDFFPGNKSGKKIRVAYIGSLDIPYLDIKLLKSLVEKFSNVEFLLVGPYQKQGEIYQLLSTFKNVNFTGAVDSDKIKDYLKDSDILLLCYKAEIFRKQLANPHKMMEYLASGNTIVATYTDEYKDQEQLLLMSKTNKDLPDLFQYAIEHLPELNSCERKEKRIAFARAHTYDKQLSKIEDFINQLPN